MGNPAQTVFNFSQVASSMLMIITLILRLHDATGCQTVCTTGSTTGCIVYTNIQPVDNRFDDRLHRVNGFNSRRQLQYGQDTHE